MEIPAGFMQANFKFSGSSCPEGAEVTLGADLSAVIDGPALVAETFATYWVNNISPFQQSTCVLDSVLVKFGPLAFGPSGEFTANEAGAQGGSGATPGVAILVQKITSLGGRAGRGRLFVPGIGETTFNEAGVMDSGVLSNWQDAFDQFVTDATDGGFTLVVLHGADSPLTTPTPIEFLSVQSKAATQRRRLRS